MSVSLIKDAIIDGAHVRITRIAPNGRVKFVKRGKVSRVEGSFFLFTEDLDSSAPGRRVYLRRDGEVGMPGWAQKIERISSDD